MRHIHIYVDEEIYTAWRKYWKNSGNKTQSAAFALIPEIIEQITDSRKPIIQAKYGHERRGRPRYDRGRGS